MKHLLSHGRNILLLVLAASGIASLLSAATQEGITQHTWLQEQNVPAWVHDAFAASNLNEKYEFSFHLNPFYLRGDFNGDEITDVAILVKEKKSEKIGIAIVHGGNRHIFLIGAGRTIGNGDDFPWMNIWGVYPKELVYRGAAERRPPTLRGEALLVEKAESASALIYWDGKDYRWYQQGD